MTDATALDTVAEFVSAHKCGTLAEEKERGTLPREDKEMLNIIHNALRDTRLDASRGDMLHRVGICADAIKALVVGFLD